MNDPNEPNEEQQESPAGVVTELGANVGGEVAAEAVGDDILGSIGEAAGDLLGGALDVVSIDI